LRQEEFASLALGYLEDLTVFARRLSGNAADADDLVQGTYERALRSWRDLRQPQACRAWLFQIARNLHLNSQRLASSRRELRLVDAEESLVPDLVVQEEVVERFAARELEAALERLPSEQRDAVLLCDLWGFAYEEIASITGWELGTVRSRIARGRTKLASVLAAGSAREGRRRDEI
jgi:RNA polymerase sigma-70 factor, ECF subfamily